MSEYCPHGDQAGACVVLGCGNFRTFTKHDAGKARHDLICPDFLDGLARVLAFGATKYADNNWRNCKEPYKRYYAALQRHLTAFARGVPVDPETGLSHLYHAACCLMFLAWFEDVVGFEPRWSDEHE